MRTLNLTAVIGAALLLAQGVLIAREAEQVRVRWDDLDARVSDRKVSLVLPDGTNIQGKVLAVEPEGLRMKVSKTSDRAVQPKGEHVIPRASVSVVRMVHYRKSGRLLCALGFAAAAGGIAAAALSDFYAEGVLAAAVPASAAAGTIGAAAGGYYIGKAIDKRVTEFHVIRE